MLVQDEIPGDDLLTRIRGHRIDAGKIGDQRVFLAADFTVLPVYRYTWKVSDVLIRARQLIKQSRFSAVLVSSQCKGQQLALRQRMLFRLVVVLSALSETGMRDRFCVRLFFFFYGIPHFCNFNPSGICKAERQFIAVNPHFHGISHRCVFYHRHLCARNDSHIEEVLPQCPLSAYGADGRRFADRQFFQCHMYILLINISY